MFFAYAIDAWGLFAMQSVFLAINVNGLRRWMFARSRKPIE
jgi:hypothetical protein